MNSLATTERLIANRDDVLPIGTKAGPWVVEREIGRGGMGVIYAVVHDQIGKRAALKLIHQHLFGPSQIERVLSEARVVNLVGHANVVDIFETGQLADGRPYIVMERLEGESLAERAGRGKLQPDLVIAILLQICDALVAAHAAGVIHRDLKPENVFLLDGLALRVKLLDWGIAKETSSGSATSDGLVVGTPEYLAPEQARGGVPTDKTDIYSLGVMAFALFLERLPFEAETATEIMTMHLRAAPPLPQDLWSDIPRTLETLLLTMLAKDPMHRPSVVAVARELRTIRAVLEARTSALLARPARTTPTPTEPPVAVGARASRRTWGVAVGTLAAAATLAMLWVTRDSVSDASAPPAARTAVAAKPSPAPRPAVVSSPVVPVVPVVPIAVAVAPLPSSSLSAPAVVPSVSMPTLVAHPRRPQSTGASARAEAPVIASRVRVAGPIALANAMSSSQVGRPVRPPSEPPQAAVSARLDPDGVLEPYP